MKRRSIELQKLIDGEWRWYCYLIDGADQPGHYGPANNDWLWAKQLLVGRTDFRIEEYDQ